MHIRWGKWKMQLSADRFIWKHPVQGGWGATQQVASSSFLAQMSKTLHYTSELASAFPTRTINCKMLSPGFWRLACLTKALHSSYQSCSLEAQSLTPLKHFILVDKHTWWQPQRSPSICPRAETCIIQPHPPVQQLLPWETPRLKTAPSKPCSCLSSAHCLCISAFLNT